MIRYTCAVPSSRPPAGIGDQRPAAGMGKVIARLGPRSWDAWPWPTAMPAHEPCTGAAETEALAGTTGVPPVGVEPTLGTLLGGRPLPLGYGGWVMIPRPVRSILAQANGERKTRLGTHIQFMQPRS